MNIQAKTQSPRLLRARIEALERQQRADQQALKTAQALLRGVEAMQQARSREAVLNGLSQTLRETISAEAVFVIADATDGTLGARKTRLQVLHPAGAEQIVPPEVESWLSKKRHLKDLSRTRKIAPNRAILPDHGSVISAPFTREDGHLIAVACWHSSIDFFTKEQATILRRLTEVLAHALDGHRLDERHALLSSVMENAVIPMMIIEPFDAGGTIVFVNRAFKTTIGPEIASAQNKDYEHGEDSVVGDSFLGGNFQKKPEFKKLREAFRAGHGGRFRVRNTRDCGQSAVDEISLTPIRKPDGTLRYMLATLIDLTRQMESQQEIRRLQDHLESAMESVSGGIMVTDPAGEVLYSNSVMHDVLHHLYGRDMRPHQAVRAFHRRVIQDKRSFEIGCPDGRLFLVRTFDSREGGLVITATDITDLKKAERVLKQRAAAMDSTTEGIAIVTKAAKITYANPAFAQISGAASPEDIVGHNWCAAFCAEDVSRLGSEVRPLVETEGSGRIEMRVCVDGEEAKRTFDVCVTRIDDQMRIVVARDITRRIEYETSRANLEQKLHDFEKNESIGRLAAGVAHDFNNLLAVINGHAALLNERTPPDKVQLYSDRISAASSRAAKMINRFLDLGMSADSDSMIDFRNLMTESQDLLKSALSADTGFSLEMADAEMEMLCCPSDLLRVALNLIQNAQDALEGKPGAIHQSLTRHLGADLMDLEFNSGSIDPEQGYACYSVRDTGSGIPPDICRRLFREHCSTKGQRGSGIGMMAIAEIVRNHEGAIRLRSTVGKGTTVEIYLPLSDFMLGRVDEGEIGSVRLDRQLVLLVDDDEQVAESIGAFLERLGAEVSICHHPEEALEAITEDPGLWSVLVSDYNMPGQNGGQLAKAAKAVDPDLPIIIVTALARKLSDPNLNEDVITALLGKPVDLNRLAHFIAQNGRSLPEVDEP